MTIREAYIEAINANFRHICVKRDSKEIYEAFNVKIKGSDNMHVFPNVPMIKLETIDDLHDKLSLCYDDFKVEGVVTWRPSEYLKNTFVLINVE